jgi:hypothetical protein
MLLVKQLEHHRLAFFNPGVLKKDLFNFLRNFSPYCIRNDTMFLFVLGVGINSKSFKYLGGLKKCVPQKCLAKSSLLPSSILLIGIPDVFELIIVPGVL